MTDPSVRPRSWLAVATAGGLGYAPVAPGTFGAAGGVLLHIALAPLGWTAAATLAAALLFLGARASDIAEIHFARHDDGRIVIDEVVGQLIALLPIFWLAPERVRDPLLLLAAFAAFRLFDIWKPGPVRAAERGFPAGWGVMLDDVAAGLLAAAALAAAISAGLLS